MNDPFTLTPRIDLVPVVHGCGDFAFAIRNRMLAKRFDCLAVPLPGSFQTEVERAIGALPTATMVVQARCPDWQSQAEWTPGEDGVDADEPQLATSFVPIDPCQPVIAALRFAIGEHIPRQFIDLETNDFLPYSSVLPDAYALKRVAMQRFAAAVLPAIPPLPHQQARDRVTYMAHRLEALNRSSHQSVLCLCSILDWPWLRAAFQEVHESAVPDHESVGETSIYQPDEQTLVFLLGELPFITALYERARRELEDDTYLSVDGIKELLLAARHAYKSELRGRSRPITPQLMTSCLRYMRNLALLERRFTPDLYTIVTAAKQVMGDTFAIHIAEQARAYPFQEVNDFATAKLGVNQMRDAVTNEVTPIVSRLPGAPVSWRSLQLKPRPSKTDRQQWKMRWNPFSQCSWPPEDAKIENFRTHVAERAMAIMGTDLAKTEKFTTSLKDGLDIRDTLRNWHTGDLYVRVIPPAQGKLDCVVMLFENPADPRDYPWRATWFAEHQNESTLCFFATNFHEELVGPGIGLATYGGAMFLFPPVAIPDIWTDPDLDFTETLEERLLAAACLHSENSRVALLAPSPPGAAWRRLAKRFGKKWIHVPLANFGNSTLAQLRMVHVLNGHEVRSYADHFIRKA